jgi:hypothetical protein
MYRWASEPIQIIMYMWQKAVEIESASLLVQTSTDQLIMTWGSSGSSPGQFNQPKGLTVDQNNKDN